MVNPNIEGKRYPRTTSYLVGREKVREFAKSIFSEDKTNFDLSEANAKGFQELVAPATFAVVIQERSLAQVLSDKEAGIDFSRVVHGDQRFILTRPILAGDELTSELLVSSVKSLAGNSMVTFETQVFDKNEDLVCTAISTLVVRGAE
jgi:acyl dehydratase